MVEQVLTPVSLPCGWLDKDGVVQREAQIVEMTGMVRKAITRPEVRTNPAKVIDTVLWSCCKNIGKVKAAKAVTDDLLVGDRDFLAIQIRKLSLGDQVTTISTCRCGESVRGTLDLSKITTKRLEDTCEIRELHDKRLRVFQIYSEEGAYRAIFRYPTGADQYIVASNMRKNPVEANMQLYRMCLVEWNGEPFEKVSPLLFDEMPVKILDDLEGKFLDAQPGPDIRESVVCPSCGSEARMSLEVSDFLFPLPRERKQQG